MHVFVTGATGWIGTTVVAELLDAGHAVTGLARSEAGMAALDRAGATPRRGDLDDLDGLRSSADAADAVVHLANKHDWQNPVEMNRAERAAVDALGTALRGSGRTLLIASGMAGLVSGRPVTELDRSPAVGPASMRGGAENLALDFAEHQVAAAAVRFAPTVHGTGDTGFVAQLVAAARRTGVSGHPGDGATTWSAVHRGDAARLVRRAVEAHPSPPIVHAVAEASVTIREIAEAVGSWLGLPVSSIDPDDAVAHFGFVGRFLGAGMSATATATAESLGWVPTGPTLAEDIAGGAYAEAAG